MNFKWLFSNNNNNNNESLWMILGNPNKVLNSKRSVHFLRVSLSVRHAHTHSLITCAPVLFCVTSALLPLRAIVTGPVWAVTFLFFFLLFSSCVSFRDKQWSSDWKDRVFDLVSGIRLCLLSRCGSVSINRFSDNLFVYVNRMEFMCCQKIL